MTAISFKSHSGDDYLEISENESLSVFLNRLKEEFDDEWYYLDVVLIKSTDFKEDVIYDMLNDLNLGNEPDLNLDEEE